MPGFPAEIREAIYHEQHKRCAFCGRRVLRTAAARRKGRNFTVDHIIPKSEGGSNERENARGLCRPCHVRRHQKAN